MAKTFEEWAKENLFRLSDDVFYSGGCFSNVEFKNALKEVWNDSRQNMTTKDI